MKKLFTLGVALIVSGSIKSQNCNLICNGDFDNPSYVATVGLTTAVNCWNTEATDGNFEIWGTGYNGVPSYSGPQHMELNATQGATIYQDFNVSTSSLPLLIGFAHRGRSGIDSMEVSIGPVGGPYTSLGIYGDGTTAWGYYSAPYTSGAAGNYRLRFTPTYWSGGNIAIGNFLDAVSVNATQPINISVNNTLVCAGTTVALTASGANSYTWTNGPSGATYIVNAYSQSVYTVNGTNSSGCPGYGTYTLNVHQPVITISPNPATVCIGSPLTLTANVVGGSAFNWNGAAGQSTLAVVPVSNSSYTVTALSTSLSVTCPATASVQVSTIPLPTVGVTASKTLVCQGAPPVVITATGASSYQWTTGANTATILSAPVTTVYSVTGYNAQGCAKTASIQVLVMACEGLEEWSANSSLFVFPNPNNGNFRVNIVGKGEYHLVNAMGQILRHFDLAENNHTTVDVSGLPDGVYFIQGSNSLALPPTKIVVQR